jgi:hypothetical protein
MNRTGVYTEFSPADIEALRPMMKVGLVATCNPDGLPHVTLISSLQANTPTQLMWGQFAEGLSKAHIRETSQAGFLIMTLERDLWRGKARFTHTATQGPEFEMYNSTPMFRYNAYFGIHTVYYLDLVEHRGRQALPMGKIVLAALQTMVARGLHTSREATDVLNVWTRRLMNKIDNLKFLSYIGADGYPLIIPVIQAQAADAEQILFSTGAFKEDLETIPEGATVAVFGMSLQMEDVLLRGRFQGIQRRPRLGPRCGAVKVDWVYSPMPPKPQQIYPPVDLEAVTAF